MTEDARAYLRQRFTNDAAQLRERVDQLRQGTRMPGPDANTSLRMAEACDDVASLVESLPVGVDSEAIVRRLLALLPALERRAQAAGSPPVRAVYAGAATRVREIAAAESRAASGAAEGTNRDANGDAHEDFDEGFDEDTDE